MPNPEIKNLEKLPAVVNSLPDKRTALFILLSAMSDNPPSNVDVQANFECLYPGTTTRLVAVNRKAITDLTNQDAIEPPVFEYRKTGITITGWTIGAMLLCQLEDNPDTALSAALVMKYIVLGDLKDVLEVDAGVVQTAIDSFSIAHRSDLHPIKLSKEAILRFTKLSASVSASDSMNIVIKPIEQQVVDPNAEDRRKKTEEELRRKKQLEDLKTNVSENLSGKQRNIFEALLEYITDHGDLVDETIWDYLASVKLSSDVQWLMYIELSKLQLVDPFSIARRSLVLDAVGIKPPRRVK